MKAFHIFRAILSVPIIATIIILAASAVPMSSAHACLPCDCTDIRSHNCFGPYHLYTPTSGNLCAIDLWLLEGGQGRRHIRVTTRDLARFPENPTENILIRQRTVIALYRLAGGEFQVNVGPDADGKVYVINFTGCPAQNVRETNFQVQPPG